MTKLTLVRHPPADWQLVDREELRGLGADLVPLTPQGVRAARDVAGRLVSDRVDAVLSSPMTRALQAAAVVAQVSGAALFVEFDLREWLPARDQMWIGPDLPNRASAEMRAHRGEWPVGDSRSWEPLSHVRQRALAVFDRYQHLQHVVVVTHGILIEALLNLRLAEAGMAVTSIQALQAAHLAIDLGTSRA